jgi:8-oxo-dGTP diphosphatase
MPEATVAAIITTPDEHPLRVLLTRRAFGVFKGCWCLPGGHIEAYEKARDAILREVKEETGLDFAAQFYACFDEIIPEKKIHAVVGVYAGVGSGVIASQPEEVSETGWFTLTEALALPLAFDHSGILAAYAANRAG